MEKSSRKTARIDKIPPRIAFSPQASTIYRRRALSSSLPLPTLSAFRERPTDTGSPNYTPPPTRYNTPLTLDVDNDRFDIFDALLGYPELTLEMSKYLDVADLIKLYAISKRFHEVVNRTFTHLILGQARRRAPHASKIFVHRCYKSLCLKDPVGRTIGYSAPKTAQPAKGVSRPRTGARSSDVRLVPSFRWLKMVIYREAIVDKIVDSLAAEGHRFWPGVRLMLHKLWFTIDIADNKHRIGLIHNQDFWTDKDLHLAATFFLKLDMLFTNPLRIVKHVGMRKMLVNQRTLSTLAAVLAREKMRNEYELLQMYIEYKGLPHRREPRRTLFGITVQNMGSTSRETWHRNGRNRLLGPDELVTREAYRRGLRFPDQYIDMMLAGYIDRRTGQDIRTPYVRRRLQTVEDVMAEIDICDGLADYNSEEDDEDDEDDGDESDTDASHSNDDQEEGEGEDEGGDEGEDEGEGAGEYGNSESESDWYEESDSDEFYFSE